MRVDFYHLTAIPLERALPRICERIVEGGERLLIVADDPLLSQLDEQLWTYAPTSFLPHAVSGKGNEAVQPVLLSTAPEPANAATNIALADGRWRDEAMGFQRVFYFFDSSSLDIARGSWRKLKAEGQAELRYWKQDANGRWVEGP